MPTGTVFSTAGLTCHLEEPECGPIGDTQTFPATRSLNRVESELKLRGYARKVQKSYMGYCRRFLQWKRDFRGERQNQVRSHLEWLLDRRVSRSAFNIAYSALTSLCGEVLKQPAALEGLRRPRGGRRLPEILSQREMLRLLDSFRNPKHRVILALVYAGACVWERSFVSRWGHPTAIAC